MYLGLAKTFGLKCFKLLANRVDWSSVGWCYWLRHNLTWFSCLPAACHDRVLMDVAHVKLASNHAVTGFRNPFCVWLQHWRCRFCEADLRAQDIMKYHEDGLWSSFFKYLYLRLLRCGHLDCQPTVRTKGWQENTRKRRLGQEWNHVQPIMESCAVHVVSQFTVIVKCNLHASFSQVWPVFHGKLRGCVGNPRKVPETERGNVAMHVFLSAKFFSSHFLLTEVWQVWGPVDFPSGTPGLLVNGGCQNRSGLISAWASSLIFTEDGLELRVMSFVSFVSLLMTNCALVHYEQTGVRLRTNWGRGIWRAAA